jgi:Flp pilus assembly protein TadD
MRFWTHLLVAMFAVLVSCGPDEGEDAPSQPLDAQGTQPDAETVWMQVLRERGLDVKKEPFTSPYMAFIKTTNPTGWTGGGAGVFVDKDTLAVSYQLIDEATSVEVDLGNCESVSAIGVVGVDSSHRIALVRLSEAPEGVTPLPIGALPTSGSTLGEHGIITLFVPDCGYLSVHCEDCLEAVDIRDLEGLGPTLIVDQVPQVFGYGSPIVDGDGALVAMLLGPAGGGTSFAVPVQGISNIERFEPVAFDAFAARERTDQERAISLLHLAERDRVQGRFAEAVARLREAISLDENDWRVYYELGVCLDMLGSPQEAIDPLYESVDIEPAYAESQYSLGIVLLKLGRPEQALEPLREAARLDPYYASARGMLAAALMQVGRLDEAITEGEAATLLPSDKPEQYLNLCIIYEMAERPEDVLRTARRWTEAQPSFAPAWGKLGEELFSSEQMTEAIEPLRRAIGLGFDDARTYALLTVALARTERYDEAMEAVNAGLKAHPDDGMLGQLPALIEQERSGGG